MRNRHRIAGEQQAASRRLFSLVLVGVLSCACADKYELVAYEAAPGDRIESEGRADPGTFQFSPDGAALDGGGGADRTSTFDAGHDGAMGHGGPLSDSVGDKDDDPASGVDGAAEPGDDAGTTGAFADADEDDGQDDGDGAGPLNNLPVCSHGSCKSSSDCGSELIGVTSCNLAVCVDGCCEIAVAPPGSPCDDGQFCTVNDTCEASGCKGKAMVCDDGLTCTSDQCDPSTGVCNYTIDAGSCEIEGVCHAAGQVSAKAPCDWCDPKLSAMGWSKKPGCCEADKDCPHGGVCDLAKCDVTTGTCSLDKKPGCCTQNAQCDDGNACTQDACDPATGQCVITPKSCPDPTSCQQGACDPKTGQCAATLKAGYCLVGFQCVVAGKKAVGQPCAVCKPKSKTDGYSVDVGALCNDGDSCTESDACQADGQCKGKAQSGCCKSNNDCQPAPGPCVIRTCDVKAGVCINQAKPGCCDKGACCDVKGYVVKGAGATCSAAILASEYKCDGNKVLRRDSHPGCTGKSADGCSSNPAHLVKGPWQTLKTCGAKTACKLAGSGQPPQCLPTGPVGSCSTGCGSKTKIPGGTCYCDAFCTKLGDCCSDFMALCGCSSGVCCDVAKKYPKSKGLACGVQVKAQYQCLGTSLQKRTAQGTCDGKATGCSTASASLKWSAWATEKTCPAGTICKVSNGGSSGTCASKPGGSCVGKCGGQSTGCWCDTDCVKYDDCCADYGSTCACGGNAGKSCKGACGKQGVGGCWCDSLCVKFGDCCADKPTCCT